MEQLVNAPLGKVSVQVLMGMYITMDKTVKTGIKMVILGLYGQENILKNSKGLSERYDVMPSPK